MTPIPPDAPLTEAEIAEAGQYSAAAITPIVPAPEPIEWPTKRADGKPFKLKLPPPKVWLYRNPDGSLYGAVGRWDRKDGKIPLPCVYGSAGDEPPTWHWSGFGHNRPPLYAERIAAAPNAPVLIVFGEKTCDAAAQYVPDGWVVTTFSGGDNAVHYTDWSVLRGHQCVIWPDLDADRVDNNGKPILPSGEQCSFTLTKLLNDLDIAVATVPVYGPRFAKAGFPRDGWDLADPLPDNVTAQAITGWITRTLLQATLPDAPEPVNDNAEPPSPPPTGVDEETHFQVLGYLNEPLRFYFLGARSQSVHEFSMTKLLKKDAMLELVPNTLHWSRQHGGEQVPWSRIGEGLADQCYAAGIFNPEQRRGRGAWLDDNRVVFHAGDWLLVDGMPVNLGQIKSRYVYSIGPSFFDNLTKTDPLTYDQGKAIISICRSMPWEGRNPLLGDLSAGLIASAAICGALRWRSHGWWTGQSGSGKSWFMENVIGKCLDGLAVKPVGDTTEPGIRRALKADSRPVVYDEAEGRGQNGMARREGIITLMRSSASEGTGVVLKADGGSDFSAFRIRSTFLLASIDVGLKEAADETRCIVLTLANQQGYTPEQKTESAARFAKIQAMAAALPHDTSARLLRRLMPLVPVIRQNVDIFSSIVGAKLSNSGTRRVGDLYGTPLACLTALTLDRVLTVEEATSIVDRYNWTPFMGRNETKEDDEILTFLLTKLVRVPLKRSGTTQERPLGELIAVASSPFDTSDLDPQDCERVLLAHGFRYQQGGSAYGNEAGFFIATRHPKLSDLLASTPYQAGYGRILARNPKAKVTGKNSVRFGSIKTTAIWLPISSLLASYTDDAE